jgi:hypothetical protein
MVVLGDDSGIICIVGVGVRFLAPLGNLQG